MAELQVPVRAVSDDISLRPTASAESQDALDALLAAHELENNPDAAKAAAEAAKVAEAAAATAAAAEAAAKAAAAPAQTPEEIAAAAAAAEAAAVAAAKAPTLDDTLLADDAEKVKAAADAAAAAAAKAAAAAPVTDAFDAIELPVNAKSKSAESFNTLKKLARDTAAKLTTERDESAKALKAAQEELVASKAAIEAGKNAALTPEVEAELVDLRRFRQSKDVESDPKFKAFDAAIDKNNASIYKKLEEGGIGEVTIKAIREIGGPEVVDWEPIMEKLPYVVKRTVEALLLDTVRQRDLKTEALEEAKASGDAYQTERATREVSALTDTANGFLKTLSWTAEKAIPATATAEEKAAITGDNEFARASMAKMKAFLSDRSPTMHAELAVGTLIAYRNKKQLEAANLRITGFEAAKAAEFKTLNEKLATVTAAKDKAEADLLAIRKAELPRGGGSGNIVGAAKPAKTGIFDTRSASDALEELAKAYTAANED